MELAENKFWLHAVELISRAKQGKRAVWRCRSTEEEKSACQDDDERTTIAEFSHRAKISWMNLLFHETTTFVSLLSLSLSSTSAKNPM
jgi:hypothetical protein